MKKIKFGKRISERKSPSKPQRLSPKKSLAKLMRENEDLSHERDALLEREAAMSDILRMIARSPTDLQPVLVPWQKVPHRYVGPAMR